MTAETLIGLAGFIALLLAVFGRRGERRKFAALPRKGQTFAEWDAYWRKEGATWFCSWSM